MSICVPTYNGERYLRECLDSARSQTMEDIEILVVDDRSSDQTAAIAAGYAADDGRFRLEVNEARLGLVENWNRCVALARGDWIKFLFQDDLIAPLCLESMLDACDGPGVAMVACRRDIAFEEASRGSEDEYAKYLAEESLERIFPGKREISPSELCEAVLDHMGMNFIGEPTAVLLRRDVFDEFGRFNPNLVEVGDLEYWVRVGVHRGLTFVPEALATFRVHPGAWSARNRREQPYRRQLDLVILLHELVFNPLFAPLRTAAARRDPPLDLKRRFAELAVRARRMAGTAGDGADRDRQIGEWRAVVSEYPALERSLPVRKLRVRRALHRLREGVLR